VKTNKVVWVGIGATGAVVIVGLFTAVFAWQGSLYVGVKDRAAHVAILKDVCSPVIDVYNAALQQDDAKAMEASLGKVVKDIDALPDNNEDPNCVFMRLTYAMRTGKVEDVKSLAGTLKTLADGGKYISGRLYNAAGIESTLGIAEQAVDTTNTVTDQGNG
jgi:hypothetical protein